MSSELVKDPTPKTHPTILTECNSSLITDRLFGTKGYHSTAPRDFATLVKLKEYRDNSDDPNENSTSKTKKDSKLKELILETFTILFFFAIPVSFVCIPAELAHRYNNLTFMLITPVLLIGFAGLMDKLTNSDPGDKNPLKKYTLIHVEKPLLSTLFLDNEKNKFYTPESVSIYQIHRKLLTKLNDIFSTDSSILQSIDFYKFSVLYDSYMNMLVFFLTNKHALSYELRDEYTQKIYEKSLDLKHEANDIVKVIQAKQEFNFKAQYDSEKLRQEMIDSEARSIMPLDS